MLDPIVTQRIQELEPTYKEFVFGETPRLIVKTFSEAQNFTEDQTIILENGFALYLMFFLNLDEFADFIVTECDLNSKDGLLLATGMSLALPAEVQNLIEKTQTLIQTGTEHSPASETKSHNTVQETSGAPTAPTHMEALRTMAKDSQLRNSGQNEGTYKSEQANILNK